MKRHYVEEDTEDRKARVSVECFGATLFQSTVSRVQITPANTAVRSFTTEVSRSSHLFYTSEFFR